MQFNKRYTTIAIYAFGVLAAAAAVVWGLGNADWLWGKLAVIGNVLRPFVYAFGIAYVINPLLRRGETALSKTKLKARSRRVIALVAAYALVGTILGVIIGVVVPQVLSSVSSLVTKLSTYAGSPNTWIPQLLALLPDIDLITPLNDAIAKYAGSIVEMAANTVKQAVPMLLAWSANLASGVMEWVVGTIISVYMLLDKEKFSLGIKKCGYAVFPTKLMGWLCELARDTDKKFGGFIVGKLLDSLIIGVICFLGMTAMGMPNAMLVSVIVGVTNVIPYFGPFIGAIPGFFIILLDDPIKSVWFLIFVLVLQQFDGNILGPKILGGSTGLSAFWVIFSITLFGGLYGFLGMFLGVPIFSVILMLLRGAVDALLAKKGLKLEQAAIIQNDNPGTTGE